jgi:hypothetical protein
MNDLAANRIFVTMLYEAERYIGCLIFDEATFCYQVFAFLKLNRGKRIKEIGDLEVTFLAAHTPRCIARSRLTTRAVRSAESF